MRVGGAPPARVGQPPRPQENARLVRQWASTRGAPSREEEPLFTRIYIDNFRCFQNFELRPARITLLLGKNGSGKSSIFEAVAGIVDLIVQGAAVDEVFEPNSRTRWDARAEQRFELDIQGAHGLYRYVLVVQHDTEANRGVVHEETVTLDGRKLYGYASGAVSLHHNDGASSNTFPFGGRRSFLAQMTDRPETKDLQWFLDYLRGTWLLRLDAGSIDGESAEEVETLRRDGRNFASWYRHLTQEHPEKLQALWATLREVVTGFSALKLVSAGGRGKVRALIAQLSLNGTSYEVGFEELSDGQRALIVLYTLLEGVEAKRSSLLLDEPEAHVGLSEVQPWLVALDAGWADAGQAFIISHHPEAIDFLAAGQAFYLSRPGGGPVRVKLADFDRDSGLPASKQLARGYLDGE